LGLLYSWSCFGSSMVFASIVFFTLVY
jgi:hypothetical protein